MGKLWRHAYFEKKNRTMSSALLQVVVVLREGGGGGESSICATIRYCANQLHAPHSKLVVYRLLLLLDMPFETLGATQTSAMVVTIGSHWSARCVALALKVVRTSKFRTSRHDAKPVLITGATTCAVQARIGCSEPNTPGPWCNLLRAHTPCALALHPYGSIAFQAECTTQVPRRRTHCNFREDHPPVGKQTLRTFSGHSGGATKACFVEFLSTPQKGYLTPRLRSQEISAQRTSRCQGLWNAPVWVKVQRGF